jgi:hypothetical protein
MQYLRRIGGCRVVALLGCLLAVPIAVGAATGTAGADDSPSTHIIPPQPSKVRDGTYDIGTREPAFTIQVDFSKAPGATEVRCQVDNGPQGPCTERQTANCPVTQCWIERASYSSDGADHVLTVSVVDSNGNDVDVAGLFYAIDSTPPDTLLAPLSAVDPLPLNFPSPKRAAFGFKAADDDTTSFPNTFECSLTPMASQAPGSWSRCASEKTLPQKLGLKGLYRFWVRAVDYVGRPDPTPESYAFSPAPCRTRAASHPRTLRAIVKKGVKLELRCVQPTFYKVDLLLNGKQTSDLHLLSPLLGNLNGRTEHPGDKIVLTVHTLKGLPKVLFRQRRLFVGLLTDVAPGIGPGVVELKLRGH